MLKPEITAGSQTTEAARFGGILQKKEGKKATFKAFCSVQAMPSVP